ncbi:MAG TPA: FAD-dependent oxidoreductase [Telluria sp.]|nr:FAD-dependent oxidoreductase [Telluria sp.]
MDSTGSIWKATAEMGDYPPLEGGARADVCVVGAGIAGLTTAYLLQKEGKSVILLEAMGVGSGETGRTTAHFFPPDERYHILERKFGMARAAMIADSYRMATGLVESIVQEEGIDCNFMRVDGYLVPQVHNQIQSIEREYVVTQRLGVEVEMLERVPGLVFDTGRCLRFANNAQFHPLRYLDGLARAFVARGGVIHCNSRAVGIDKLSKEERTVRTLNGHVHAANVVLATHTPFNDTVVMHTKQAAYSTYVLGMRVPKDAIPPMLMWDDGDPYYYVRLAAIDEGPDDILIVGGQDHKTGQDEVPQHRWHEIEMWTRNRFPQAGEVVYRWSGEVMEPADGVAFLGNNPMDGDNVYIITGDSGNGMTHCTAGAMLVRDKILGRVNEWEEIYAPSRKPIHGVGDFAAEQINVVEQYADWVRGGEVETPAHIAPGEGALIRHGVTLYAVHRPVEGALQVLSAKCTHLGCAVHWNSAEKSWDCPCHGSRFSTTGEALHGPAVKPLQILSLPRD